MLPTTADAIPDLFKSALWVNKHRKWRFWIRPSTVIV